MVRPDINQGRPLLILQGPSPHASLTGCQPLSEGKPRSLSSNPKRTTTRRNLVQSNMQPAYPASYHRLRTGVQLVVVLSRLLPGLLGLLCWAWIAPQV
jgi:hypothetical protein